MAVQTKHILLASPPLYGHAGPLLQLGRKLSNFHHVTFAVSESLLDKMRKELENDAPTHTKYGPITLIGVKEEPNIIVPGPPSSPNSLRQVLLRSCPGMRELFLGLTPTSGTASNGQRTVDVVIAEIFLTGPAAVLTQVDIPYYLFNSARVWLTQTFLTFNVEAPVCPGIKESYFEYRTTDRLKMYDCNLEANKDILMENITTISSAEGIIFNSLREAEAEALNDIISHPAMHRVDMYFVGPLQPDTGYDSSKTPLKQDEIQNWLDTQNTETVVYVSFGSIAVPAAEQITEIGKALSLLKAPFLWSLPAAHHVHLPHEIQATMKSTDSQGTDRPFLILPWAPQKQILAHPATGVFVSHCGWNSTLETLACGVPVVAWPMFGDQMLNAEWLEKEGAGMLIHGTGITPDRVVPAEEIAKVLRQVMHRGRDTCDGLEHDDYVYKAGAEKWQTIIEVASGPGGSSSLDFTELTKFQRTY